RVVEVAGLQVLRNVGVDEPYLSAARIGVGFRNRRATQPQRLDLAAGQRNASLEDFADLVIEAGATIIGDDLLRSRFLLRHRIWPQCGGAAGACAAGGTPLLIAWLSAGHGSRSAARRPRAVPPALRPRAYRVC